MEITTDQLNAISKKYVAPLSELRLYCLGVKSMGFLDLDNLNGLAGLGLPIYKELSILFGIDIGRVSFYAVDRLILASQFYKVMARIAEF